MCQDQKTPNELQHKAAAETPQQIFQAVWWFCGTSVQILW
jgi:hypothetical protein